MPLKNVSFRIAADDRTMSAVVFTLKELGYSIFNGLWDAVNSYPDSSMGDFDFIVYRENDGFCQRGYSSLVPPPNSFDNLEDFLVWYFEDEVQKEIEEINAEIERLVNRREDLEKSRA